MGKCATRMAEVTLGPGLSKLLAVHAGSAYQHLSGCTGIAGCGPASVRSSQASAAASMSPCTVCGHGTGVRAMARGSTSRQVGVAVRGLLDRLISARSAARRLPFRFVGQTLFSVSGTFHVSGS